MKKSLDNDVTYTCLTCGAESTYKKYNRPRRYCSKTCKGGDRSQVRSRLDEYIARANRLHDFKFDYSGIDKDLYQGTTSKVSIICPVHGKFIQVWANHLVGKGCKSCANDELALSQDDFIHRARGIHGTKYDYTKVVYVDYRTHVSIICPKHGEFGQSPSQHLCHKAGCSECAKEIRISSGEREWLDSLGLLKDSKHRQVRFEVEDRVIYVDGYDPVNNTIYEYFGDYWHGNPNLYEPDAFNHLSQKTFGQLYSESMTRIEKLKDLGFEVIYIWEETWLRSKG